MTHLLYASDEMFSSTQLVRKSKDIFDKLSTNKIDKAVILRDGKPNFMLLDFHKYEEIMKEYQELKSNNSSKIHISKQNILETTTIDNSYDPIELKLDFSDILNDEIEVEEMAETQNENLNTEEIAQADLAKALAQIEALDLDPKLKSEAREKLKENSPAQIKEFWN